VAPEGLHCGECHIEAMAEVTIEQGFVFFGVFAHVFLSLVVSTSASDAWKDSSLK